MASMQRLCDHKRGFVRLAAGPNRPSRAWAASAQAADLVHGKKTGRNLLKQFVGL